MNQGQNQNTDQYGSNGNFNSYNNNNGSYQQGNDWQNGGYSNSGYNGGSSFNGNGGYNGGYSNSGRQPGRRLSKSTTNKMVCGVCAGIAEYFNWDPTIIRIIWIAASIFLGAGFLGLIAYFIVAVIMPEG
ncbi:PspC domain-containing protein [Eisenbergiella massiliensis]|uniref:PspC domain-containing protein n=2 Tax=Lachnospiraceae TaxID=186803 RepID=A0A3E3J0N5_9FIRM|nr:PspC domain-containing protein [Eisenbergiella massiliensis]